MKLKRPEDWPPPPPEKPEAPPTVSVGEDDSKVSLGWLKHVWSGLDPSNWNTKVPDKPSTTPPPPNVGGYVPTGAPPFLPPPRRVTPEKDWSYELVSEAQHITSKLNYYKEKKRLRNIVSMTATDNTITILLEVYDW